MQAILKFNTDISNVQSGEAFEILGEKIRVVQKSYDISFSFEEILQIARETKSPIIIRTLPYGNKTGRWYIKNFKWYEEYGNKFEYIKFICETNHQQKKWKRRECFLINWDIL